MGEIAAADQETLKGQQVVENTQRNIAAKLSEQYSRIRSDINKEHPNAFKAWSQAAEKVTQALSPNDRKTVLARLAGFGMKLGGSLSAVAAKGLDFVWNIATFPPRTVFRFIPGLAQVGGFLVQKDIFTKASVLGAKITEGFASGGTVLRKGNEAISTAPQVAARILSGKTL